MQIGVLNILGSITQQLINLINKYGSRHMKPGHVEIEWYNKLAADALIIADSVPVKWNDVNV